MKPNERIICALDMPDPEEARRLVEALDSRISFFKVGMLLYLAGGNQIVDWILERGNRVFLDLKFYDVPKTVAQAVKQVAGMGVSFLTIHGNKAIVEKAAEAAEGSSLKLLAVTVLTSLDQEDIRDLGYPCSLEELVFYRARQAAVWGCGGIIASPREALLLRKEFKDRLLIITPGIRPRGWPVGGHKRSSTPQEAILAGADYLVIGQPIIHAPDPAAAVLDIIKDISS